MPLPCSGGCTRTGDRMSAGGEAFSGRPDADGGRRRVGLGVAAAVAFVVIATLKPWDGRAIPAATAPALTPRASAATAVVSAAVPPPSPIVGSPGSTPFTTLAPPPVAAAWTGLRWTRVGADDALADVSSVAAWHGGYLAIGQIPGSGEPAPLWTSSDGARWEPLLPGGPATFWPGLDVAAVAPLRTGLVALTGPYRAGCVGLACSDTLPPMAWTSADGRSWTPRGEVAVGPASPGGLPPLLAAGPAGLVALTSGPGSRVALSADGATWRSLPAGTFPAHVVVNDLASGPNGLLAVGFEAASGTRWNAVVVSSTDGRTWRASTLPDTAPDASPAAASLSVALSVTTARLGLVVAGRDLAAPGRTLWWQSTDGRTWRQVATLAPLGRIPCADGTCGVEADGSLAGDGRWLIALRGGSAAAAWISADGRSWRRLAMSGDLPDDQATGALLLPGGVLLRDGTTSWYGAATW